jgi:ADP-heptose:LPS heptosyltransferase
MPECRITLLTSTAGNVVAPFISAIDEVMVFDMPWYMSSKTMEPTKKIVAVLKQLKQKKFDGAIIFSVYDKSPLPAALLCYMAEIPRILAYCQENPAFLLSDWIPDREPLWEVKHEVRRQLDLVGEIGARTSFEDLQLNIPEHSMQSLQGKLGMRDLDYTKPFVVLHPGVNFVKRQYPAEKFAMAAKGIISKTGLPVYVTGVEAEQDLCLKVVEMIGGDEAFTLAGLLTFDEFVSLASLASVVITNNTATSHIAAATKTPVVVMYALTNPQHAPWMVKSKVLAFGVPEELKSRSPQLTWVNERSYKNYERDASSEDIVKAVEDLLVGGGDVHTEAL